VKRSKLILIGFVFILSIGVLIWGYNFLKGNDIFSHQRVFYGKYKDVGGLLAANPVLINGMQVGQVRSLYFAPDMSGDIIVEFLMSSDFPIPKNTQAIITNANLLGDKAVTFKLGDSKELAENGDTLVAKVESTLAEAVNEQLAPLKNRAETLLNSVDELVLELNKVFAGQAGQDLRESFKDIKATITHLNSTSSNIDTLVQGQVTRIGMIIDNIESFTNEMNNNKENITGTLQHLNTLSDSLAKIDYRNTFDKIDNTMAELKDMLNKINSGEGSMGKLMVNDSLYMELNKSANELNKLLKDIRENPKRYVKFSLF
jgi:phospholipid/cholesterol/gamma-HCH transport system substrate-binding protein